MDNVLTIDTSFLLTDQNLFYIVLNYTICKRPISHPLYVSHIHTNTRTHLPDLPDLPDLSDLSDLVIVDHRDHFGDFSL